MLYLTILSDIMNPSSVGIATGYGLDGRSSILGRGKRDFSPLHSTPGVKQGMINAACPRQGLLGLLKEVSDSWPAGGSRISSIHCPDNIYRVTDRRQREVLSVT
jgi:hypothetical protein